MEDLSEVTEILSEKTLSHRRFSLESFNRIYNIPLIGNTIDLTSDLYEKVKESNAAANFILHSAEQSVHAAVSLAEPVLITFQKPLMVTDNLICNTMDKIAESNAKAKEAQQKVRCISEMNIFHQKVTNVIVNLPVQSAINCAKAVSSYSVEKVGHFVTQIKHQHQSNGDEFKYEKSPRETEPGKQGTRIKVPKPRTTCARKLNSFQKCFNWGRTVSDALKLL